MPTLYDNFERVRQYIDQHQGGGGDMSAYVTKDELSAQSYLTAVPAEYITDAELSACGYLTSIPSTYASYNGVYSYLHSMGIDKKSNWGCYIDSAYITDSELSGDIVINGISTWELPTYAAISNMGYVTSNDISGKADKSDLRSYLSVSNWSTGDYDIQLRKTGLTLISTNHSIAPATIAYEYVDNSSYTNAWIGLNTLKNYVNGRIAEIEASYATTGDLPVIDENIIPKETGTYTLGDSSHIYSNTYSRGVYLGTGVRMFSESSASSNDMAISLGGVSYFYLNTNRFAPNGAANNEKLDLGTSDRKWNHFYGKSVNVDTTYTSNLYTENVSYTSGKSSIKMNDRNVDIWANNKKMVNVSDYNGVVPTQTNVNLGGSSNKWAATYTYNLYADTIHNFIWTGTSAEYAALDNYTSYQIYMIKES